MALYKIFVSFMQLRHELDLKPVLGIDIPFKRVSLKTFPHDNNVSVIKLWFSTLIFVILENPKQTLCTVI